MHCQLLNLRVLVRELTDHSSYMCTRTTQFHQRRRTVRLVHSAEGQHQRQRLHILTSAFGLLPVFVEDRISCRQEFCCDAAALRLWDT